MGNIERNKLTKASLLLLFVMPITAVIAQKNFFTTKVFPVSEHDHKNQLWISAGVGSGYDMGLSYALSNHIYFFGNAGFNNALAKRIALLGDQYSIKHNDHFYNAGAGYFNMIKFKETANVGVYLSASKTEVHNYWYFDELGWWNAEYTNALYNSFYVGTLMTTKWRKADASINLRYCRFRYKHFDYYETNDGGTTYPVYTVKNLNGSNVEIIGGAGYGWNKFKVDLHLGISWPTGKQSAMTTSTQQFNNGVEIHSFKEDYYIASAFLRLGIRYQLDLRKR